MITISKLLYDTLQENTKWLQCLREAGVDQWSGYEAATERYREFGRMKRAIERAHVVPEYSEETLRAMGLIE